METAIAYIRVSDSRQVTEGSSLTVQQDLVIRHAVTQGYKLHKVFIEEGESAKTDDRPVLKRLLLYCAENAGTVTVVIFPKIDRFARFVEDYTMLKRRLRELGIRLDSVGEKIDDSPVGHLNETMLAAIAQFDNEIRSERCKGGMVQAVKEGRFVWKAPVGFVNVRHEGRGTIAPDPAKASVVNEVFERMSSGRYRIAEVLAFAGENGVTLSSGSLHHILRNKAYIGVLEAFGLSVPGAPPFVPIVSRDAFFGAQATLRTGERKGTSVDRRNVDFPLRGTLKCPRGHVLGACLSTGRGKKYPYYRCASCARFNLGRDRLERAFAAELDKFKPNPAKKAKVLGRVHQQYEARTQSAKDHVRGLTDQISDRVELQHAILVKNAKGVVPDELARSEIDRIETEIALLRSEKARWNAAVGDVSEPVSFAITFLSKVGRFWRESSVETKKKIQRFFFPNGLEVSDRGILRTADFWLLENVKHLVNGSSLNLVDQDDETTKQALVFLIELHERFGPASSGAFGERPGGYSSTSPSVPPKIAPRRPDSLDSK